MLLLLLLMLLSLMSDLQLGLAGPVIDSGLPVVLQCSSSSKSRGNL